MKHFIIIFLLFSAVMTSGQRVTQVQLADAATMTDDDTTVWILMKKVDGRALDIIFTELSANTDTLDVGVSQNDSTFRSISNAYNGVVTFPMVLDKTSYTSTGEGTTSNGIAVDFPGVRWKYIVFRYRKVGSTSGKLYLQY